MKKVVHSLFFLVFSLFSLGAQDSLPECNKLNIFLQNVQQVTQLKPFTIAISKTGLIEFDLQKSLEFGTVEDNLNLFGLDDDHTFELIDESTSAFETQKYIRYQQYYKGVKVDGGGYSKIIPTDPGGNPCNPVFLLATHLLSEIDISTTPTVSKKPG